MARRTKLFVMLLLLIPVAVVHAAHAAEGSDSLASTVTSLATASFPEKQEAVAAIAATRRPNARAVLSALLEGNLYFRTADQQVFIVQQTNESLALTDPVTLQSAGTGPADDFTKITTNNGLRKSLRGLIAGFDLADPDTNVRLAAVNEMLRSLDEEQCRHPSCTRR